MSGKGCTASGSNSYRSRANASRQADIANRRHEEQTQADRARRVTETFSKAVEQLGGEKMEVRVGGIYTLERLWSGALLLEQNDEWAVQRARYMSLETIAPLSHDLGVSLPLIAAWHGGPIRLGVPLYTTRWGRISQ